MARPEVTGKRVFLRKKAVAQRYGCHERTIDAMSADGRLPKPYYHGTRIPRWAEDELDDADRRATRAVPTTPGTVARDDRKRLRRNAHADGTRGNPTDAGDRLDPPTTISAAKVKRQ